MSNIDLNKLRDRAYQCACAHGFHDEALSDEHFLMLVITELAEAVEADRIGRHADKLGFDTGISNAYHGVVRDDWFTYCYNRCIKGTVEEELSDAVIRLLDLAGRCQVNITVKESDLEDDTVRKAYEDKTFTEAVYDIVVLLPRYDGNYDLSVAIDSMIFSLFAFSKHLGIDLLWHIEQKMKYNEFRGYKHGKLY